MVIKSRFIKDVITLSSGSVLSQIITIGAAPIITRMFTPENFGLFALFVAHVGIISITGTLTYDRAILLSKEDEEAMHVISLSVIILLAISFIVSVIALFLNHNIAYFFGSPDFSFWVLFIGIGVLLNGLLRIFRYWHIRKKEFKTVSISRINEAGISVITKIAVGFLLGAYAGGLIGGTLLGSFTALILVVLRPKVFNFKEIKNVSKKSLYDVAKKYKKFPYFATWNAFLNLLSQRIIVFSFSIFFSPAIVGFYSLGNRVLRQPIITISGSIFNVYFQKSAQQHVNNIKILPDFKKVIFYLIIIGMPPFLILGFFGEFLFGLVFGKDWGVAGTYVQVMAPWFFFLFIVNPANAIYEVCQKQDLKLAISVLRSILSITAVIVGYYVFKDPIKTLFLFVLVNVLIEFILILGAFFIAKKVDREK